ncbi:inner membrane complex protein 1h, putative [Hepatocystis sp. ex Piliocolobus tephrosceles]|nr:inner membrane complex protein 1h, putative [Hepatocystis sp. ex Piliocolobus tephrosceles]
MLYQKTCDSSTNFLGSSNEINDETMANNVEDENAYITEALNAQYYNEHDMKNPSFVNNPQLEAEQSEYVMRTEDQSGNVEKYELDERTTNEGSYPRKVMTILGPLPLPEEFKKNIPEKFVAKPIVEEREIYVSKKERKQREIEVPHVKYEHTFEKIKRTLNIKKLVPSVTHMVKEMPKEVLKPVIEEKIIEVPQGIKYVEVPVEVPCLYPPKIVPKVVTQYVERIVETIKPVVQEKIIEVPQTVVKQVPKIKTVEVPYYVPRYVEKIVEVPFKPNGEMPKIGSHIPFNISDSLPPLKPTQFLNNQNINEYNKNMENVYPFLPEHMCCNPDSVNNNNGIMMGKHMANSANELKKNNLDMSSSITASKPLDNNLTNNNGFNNNGMMMTAPGNFVMPSSNSFIQTNLEFKKQHENLQSQIEKLKNEHNLPDGIKWQYPDGVTPMNTHFEHRNNMPPLVFTCPPEVGNVTCVNKNIKPDILTKTGVFEFNGFKKNGTAQALFPPLAHHNRVPFLPPPAPLRTPDVEKIRRNN